MRGYYEYMTVPSCLSLLLTFSPTSSVDPVHRLQAPVHGWKFLPMGLSSYQEKLLQCSLLRATLSITWTCSSMDAMSVTCYSVCSVGPWLLSGEPAPAWTIHGHSSFRKALHQCELSRATVSFRKACYRMGSPQSGAPPGHIHWTRMGCRRSRGLGAFNDVSSLQAADK